MRAGAAGPAAHGEVLLEAPAGRRVEGNEPILSELGRADDEARRRDVVEVQSERLGDAQARHGEEREQRDEGPRTEHVPRPQCRGGAQHLVDLRGRVEERLGTSARRTEGEIRWHLVARILGDHRPCKPPHDLEPVATRSRGGGGARPRHGALGRDVVLTTRRGVSQEVLEQARLDLELEARRPVQRDVARYLVAQHRAPSGHGCATVSSVARSILA
jgi:hypothetical protein